MFYIISQLHRKSLDPAIYQYSTVELTQFNPLLNLIEKPAILFAV